MRAASMQFGYFVGSFAAVPLWRRRLRGIRRRDRPLFVGAGLASPPPQAAPPRLLPADHRRAAAAAALTRLSSDGRRLYSIARARFRVASARVEVPAARAARSVARLPVRVAAGKQRALLAVLLLNANRTVSRDQIVDELWGEDVPESAQKMVQIHVSQLRKALPEPRSDARSRLPARGRRRRARPAPVRALVADGAAGTRQEDARTGAASCSASALALWRGPALAEFSEPFASARERRASRSCASPRSSGGSRPTSPSATTATSSASSRRWSPQHPLRERLRSQHMLALYRSGRQAEALAATRRSGACSRDELGIEPSASLRELERLMLHQDPALEPTARAATRGATLGLPRAARPTSPTPAAATSGSPTRSSATGPLDLVLVHGWVCTFQPGWENPKLAASTAGSRRWGG